MGGYEAYNGMRALYFLIFCRNILDGVKISGHNLSLQFDRDGSRYRRGSGLTLYIDGVEADHRHSLQEPFEIAL